MQKIVILGSTGSIGENALRVASCLPDEMRVTGLAAQKSAERVVEQAVQFGVKRVALADEAAAARAEALAAPHGITVLKGAEGVAALAEEPEADTVLCALVGMAGLRPAINALESGKALALATKEVLVSAGELVMDLRAKLGGRILPVDSEHSAIFQALQSARFTPACVRAPGAVDSVAEERIARLILTASGGPFFGKDGLDFDRVTVAEALNHPRWKMGPKVTIDSATMMNKGLEILEAAWLFNMPVEKIDVVVHQQSIVHSLVEFIDGSTMAQLSPPDMRLPIQFALTYPDRRPAPLERLDLVKQASLTFAEPDERRFPCLALARAAMRAGGTMPAVMNAADEIAVRAFMDGRIAFSGIWRVIERVMAAHNAVRCSDLGTVLAADASAREAAERAVAEL